MRVTLEIQEPRRYHLKVSDLLSGWYEDSDGDVLFFDSGFGYYPKRGRILDVRNHYPDLQFCPASPFVLRYT